MMPISASTRIGRHWSNDIQLDDPNIPMYWLELRWKGKDWGWRSLSAKDRTRGTGAIVDTIWRRWSEGGTIRLEGLSVDILQKIICIKDVEPPLMIEDLQSKKRYVGEKSLKYIEVQREGKIIPIDDTERGKSLEDGDIFTSLKKVFRIHCTQDVFVTNRIHLDISNPDVFLEIDLKKREAVFIYHHRQVVVQGIVVLTLATYVNAVLDGVPWIGTAAAFENWKKLGGPDRSTMERLGWERGRIRNQLSKQGCFALDKLFQSRRGNNSYEMSICLTKEQVSYVDSDR